MPIPSYKQIHIKSEDGELIYKQLSSHRFGQVPYILSIDHLANQQNAIKVIEEFFAQNGKNHYPYPTYVITNLTNYTGPMLTRESIKECPKFFKQKIKQLNSKENKMLQKIYLKQQNLLNMRAEEYSPYLEDYAKSHKKLYSMSYEKEFYKDLIKQLERYYEQEK